MSNCMLLLLMRKIIFFTGGRQDQHVDPHSYIIEHLHKEDQATHKLQEKQKQEEQLISMKKHQQQVELKLKEQKKAEAKAKADAGAEVDLNEQTKKHDEKVNVIMDRLYYKKLNFDGIDILYKKAKLINKDLNKEDVSKWLKKQAVYQKTIERPLIQPIENLPIFTTDPYSFQIDLTFLPKYKDENDGNYVLFTAININTRYSFASYGRDKKGDTIIKMLDDFLKNALTIHSITSDSGSEFTSGASTEWFRKHDIKTYFWTGDSHRLGIINRFHRTLKQKLLKYMIATDSTRWIDIMKKLIDNLNNTFNRGIGMTPAEATNPIMTSQIINDAINKTVRIHKSEPSFEIGDLVRVLKKKSIFGKQETNYSDQVLKIIKVNKNTVSIVDIETGEEYHNVKNKWLLVVNGVENNKESINKEAVEKSHKVSVKIKKDGIERNDSTSELISTVKGRERKKTVKYDV